MSRDTARQTEEHRRLLELQERLGHRFTDPRLLELAITHASRRDEWNDSNERLEFLGDAVLGLAIAEHLFCALADQPEGALTRIRSRIVSRDALARVARKLGLRRFLRIGKGLRRAGALPPSILADAVEAVVGAIYLDAGYETARERVLEWCAPALQSAASAKSNRNFKAALQQVAQRLYATTPEYRVLSATGPDHARRFEVSAVVADHVFSPGVGTTKKQAEQRAAQAALRELKREHGSGFPGVSIP